MLYFEQLNAMRYGIDFPDSQGTLRQLSFCETTGTYNRNLHNPTSSRYIMYHRVGKISPSNLFEQFRDLPTEEKNVENP